MFILALVFGIFTLAFETRTVEHEYSTITSYSVNPKGLPFAAYTIVVAAYFIGTEALLAATPGKALLDLRIASVNGRAPNARQVIVRNLMRVVDGLPILYLVGIIAIAASKRDQRVGDMAAGTIVVRAQEARGQSEQIDAMMSDPSSPLDP